MRRTAAISLAFAVALTGLTSAPALDPSVASAGPCVKFVKTNFDAPGNDNLADNLNGEWVRIKNVCATARKIGGWKIHDYGRKHTYTFPAGFKIGPGKTVTLYSGTGTNSSSKRYWGRTYGAVWNNAPPEYANLRRSDGTLIHKYTQY